MLVLLLAACTLNAPDATPVPTMPENDTPLIVAWMDGGDLFVWRSNQPQPQRIASGAVIRPWIAPDGAWIAYLRGPAGDPRSLWISDTPGANERQLLDMRDLPDTDGTRRLDQIVWSADSRAIYFNTITGEGMDARPADDLWRVDVMSGIAARLLPDGAGGAITLSPDGTRLALAAAGEYSQPGETGGAPSRIVIYSLDQNDARVVLEYPAVATASQRRWYPFLRWLPDSSQLYAAIPSADLVYGEGQTALWALPVVGEAVALGTVDADFFGLPVFSADGAWIAYFQRRAAPDQALITLMIAASDGSGAAEYVQGAPGALTPPEWLPGAAQFLYGSGAPGECWIGGPGATPVRFPAVDVSLLALTWADAATYVFASSVESGITLSFGLLDVPTSPQRITTLAALPSFDARLP